MHKNQESFATSVAHVSRFASLVVLAGVATLSLHAQQPVETGAASARPAANLLTAAITPATDLANPTLGYVSSVGAGESSSAENFIPDVAVDADSTQPPPRRRYGRPRYNDNSHNPDGSSKFAFEAGAGFTLPIGNTNTYYTPGWKFSVGAGRAWSKKFAVLAQFDYDHLGLQGSTIANQEYIYNYTPPNEPTCTTEGDCYTGLDGNAHDWSFTLNPTFTYYQGDTWGSYAVVGAGFYHKVTNFTLPEEGEECYIYCEVYEENVNVDHYTSNSFGVNAGLGLTWKISRFANEKLFMEARYILTLNSQRYGVTAFNVPTDYYTYTGTNLFPANSNRTTYIPVTFGIRF